MQRTGRSQDQIACSAHKVDPIAYRYRVTALFSGPDTNHVPVGSNQVAVKRQFVGTGGVGEDFDKVEDTTLA